MRLRMFLCLCCGVLTCLLISYAYAFTYAQVKTSLICYTNVSNFKKQGFRSVSQTRIKGERKATGNNLGNELEL